MSAPRIDIVHPLSEVGPGRRLGCILGSFDPPHRGHERMVEELAGHCDRVLLLVPRHHFDKRVRRGVNASYAQRVEMLGTVCDGWGGRVGAGSTEVVLFLELGPALEALFPDDEVLFGMGNDTLDRVARSEDYYARRGLPFGPEEAVALERLLPRILVFGRSRQMPGDFILPDVLGISSTLVRERTRQLWSGHADGEAWRASHGCLVSPAVLDLIRSHRLYTRNP